MSLSLLATRSRWPSPSPVAVEVAERQRARCRVDRLLQRSRKRAVAARYREQQLARHEVLISDSQFSVLALAVRTNPQSRLGEERRSRLQVLRETLPLEDQALLVLRIERELDWRDLARVMNAAAELDDVALDREAARLRKRFQAAKERLRALIRAEPTTP